MKFAVYPKPVKAEIQMECAAGEIIT